MTDATSSKPIGGGERPDTTDAQASIARALQAAIKAARGMPAADFDHVERRDGLACFMRDGRPVGWMNWADYEAVQAGRVHR